MKDFREHIMENSMVAKIPVEYAEYLQTHSKKLVFHDPENDEQAKIALRIKNKTLKWLVPADLFVSLIFIYVIVTQNTLLVISLMGLLTVSFVVGTIRIVNTKPQVVVGRAVAKREEWDTGNKYRYYVSIAVDEPEKAIHSRIPISKKDYERVEEGMRIMVVNPSGQGVILD